jgi:hypothetical protein
VARRLWASFNDAQRTERGVHTSLGRALAAITLSAAVAGCAATGRTAVTTPLTARSTGHSARISRPAAARTSALQVRFASWRLPTPLSREVVFPTHEGIELVGGLRADGTSSRAVVVIDPSTGVTHYLGALAAPVHDAAGAEIAGQRFVFGGGTTTSDATIQRLTRRGSILTSAELPAPRSDLAAARIGSRTYLIGGYDGTSWATAVLSTSDGARFTVGVTMPVPVRYPAVAAVGSTIWVFGGETPHGPTAVIQRIDVATGTASVVGRMAQPLSDASAVVLGGEVLLCGGSLGGHASSLVRRFDLTTARLSTVGRLPAPLTDAGSLVLGSTAYLLGGETPGTTARVVTLQNILVPAGTGSR